MLVCRVGFGGLPAVSSRTATFMIDPGSFLYRAPSRYRTGRTDSRRHPLAVDLKRDLDRQVVGADTGSHPAFGHRDSGSDEDVVDLGDRPVRRPRTPRTTGRKGRAR